MTRRVFLAALAALVAVFRPTGFGSGTPATFHPDAFAFTMDPIVLPEPWVYDPVKSQWENPKTGRVVTDKTLYEWDCASHATGLYLAS